MGIGNRIENKSTEKEAVLTSVSPISPIFSMTDLILPRSTVSALLDFLSYQRYEDLVFNQWGLISTHKYQRQRAINFYGDSGTGKTMAAHAIANEIGKQLVIVNYAELESKYVGETSKNITKLFEDAKKEDAIILFDEADAMLSRRVSDMRSSADVSVNQTRSVLLTLMNQYNGIIIFTTNFIENYDPAFMRRILSHIHFSLPDTEGREKLWKKYIPERLPNSADIMILSEKSKGLSGSDIANCVLKAALSAARKGDHMLEISHFLDAINEVNNSKTANLKPAGLVTIEQRNVSEEYVKEKISLTGDVI